MADLLVAAKVRYRLTPWWAKVLVIFAASRVVTTSILLTFASMQGANAWTGAQPGYFDFAKIWDGHWYYIVSVVGYPSELPVTDDGHVAHGACVAFGMERTALAPLRTHGMQLAAWPTDVRALLGL